MKPEMKILDGLWQVGGDVHTSPEDAAVYLLRLGDEAALVDAGCGKNHKQIVKNIGECLPASVRITHLFLTHCHWDHAGGARRLAQKTRARIVAHEAEAGYLEAGDSQVTAAAWYGATMEPFTPDVLLTEAVNAFPLGNGEVTAHHVPGHSPGSVAYTARVADQKVLFGQDVHGPISPLLLSDEAAWRASLEKLLAMEADVLCEGHFGVFHGKGAVKRFIRSYLDKK